MAGTVSIVMRAPPFLSRSSPIPSLSCTVLSTEPRLLVLKRRLYFLPLI